MSDRVTKFAADFNTTEVLSEEFSSKEDFALALGGTESGHNTVESYLRVVIELTEVVEGSVEVHAEPYIPS